MLLADVGGDLGGGIGFAGLCLSIAAYNISVQWQKVRLAQVEADLKREMLQKGLSAEEIEGVLKASGRSPIS